MIGLIEDHDGVENVEAIAQECGFDGLMFGPFDLGMSIGMGVACVTQTSGACTSE
jgi:2-keto-3-deoxy-L-rhamnonate aldolase RhmA